MGTYSQRTPLMAVSILSKDSVNFTWAIKNFSCLRLKNSEQFIHSKYVRCSNTYWVLQVEDSDPDFHKFNLRVKCVSAKPNVYLSECQFNLINENGNRRVLPTEAGNLEATASFISDEDYFTDNTARINCEFSIVICTNHDVEGGIPENQDGECAVNKTGILSEDLENLYQNQLHCDVTLHANGKTFPVHRAILAARSTVFAAMFEHPMEESKSGSVEIKDIDASTLNDLIRYMYTGRVTRIGSDNVFHLYPAADKYELIELRDECTKFLMANISVENFCRSAVLADMHKDNKLKNCIKRFYHENSNLVISSDDWEPFFAEHSDLFKSYLERSVRQDETSMEY